MDKCEICSGCDTFPCNSRLEKARCWWMVWQMIMKVPAIQKLLQGCPLKYKAHLNSWCWNLRNNWWISWYALVRFTVYKSFKHKLFVEIVSFSQFNWRGKCSFFRSSPVDTSHIKWRNWKSVFHNEEFQDGEKVINEQRNTWWLTQHKYR